MPDNAIENTLLLAEYGRSQNFAIIKILSENLFFSGLWNSLIYSIVILKFSFLCLSGVHGEVWNVIKHTCFPLFGQMLALCYSFNGRNQLLQATETGWRHSRICVIQIYVIKYKCQNCHALKHSVLHFPGSGQGLKLTINIEKDEYMSGPLGGSGMLVGRF